MQRLWYATTNRGKVLSLQRRLHPHGFSVEARPLSISEPRLRSVVDLALYKAMFAFEEIGEPVVTLDAGFFIHPLGGFPGTFVHSALHNLRLEGLLKLVDGTDRRCEFRHALAYRDEHDRPVVFAETIPGVIAPQPRGEMSPMHWSPLALIFIPDGQDITLAEMSETDYAKWRAQRADGGKDYAHLFLDWYRDHRGYPLTP